MHYCILMMFPVNYSILFVLYFKNHFCYISAAGLYYIAEVIEEYTVMTCRIIRILILVIYIHFICKIQFTSAKFFLS